ncbi:MAG: hypothetical protein WCS33_00725 [Candidatus Caldatribacteriota bacterium]
MRDFKIVFDMDEVIVQFLKKLLKEYNLKFNKNLTEKDFTEWQFGQDIANIFLQEGFFDDLEPYPNAIEIVSKLKKDKFGILIATDAAGQASIAKSKFNWLRKHMPFIDCQKEVIITGSKQLINANVIVDDSPFFLENFQGIKIAVDKPYNKNIKTDYRVYNDTIEEIYDIVHRII